MPKDQKDGMTVILPKNTKVTPETKIQFDKMEPKKNTKKMYAKFLMEQSMKEEA